MRERPAAAAPVRELSGWARRPRSSAQLTAPATREALTKAVGHLDPPRGLLARGLGRSYNDAALNAGGVVLETTGVSSIQAFDAGRGVITVDAGLSIDRLMRAVTPHGWFPAVVPGTAHVTVGGAIAADIHGKNHHRDGSFCHWTNGLRLQAPGQDPRIVTRDNDPEAFYATAGGMGLTGVIVDATLQLVAVETAWMRVHTVRTADLDDTITRMADLDVQHRYAVAWLDLAPGSSHYGRGVITNGDHAARDELPAGLPGPALGYPRRACLSVPDLVPSGLLRPGALRLLNAAWYRLSRPGTTFQPVTGYFFPLDRLAEWNRAYGQRGFLQYQFAVPERDTVGAVVERLRGARCPVALAVLKRFGPQEGYLSFPLPGWTLAVDIPVGAAGLPELLDGCDDLVASAGGRVYLAKDARIRPEAFRTMYPRHKEWRDIRERLDPRDRLRSDLARRLELAR